MDIKCWSAYKLAKEAGLPQSTISHLFKKNYAPSYPTIEAICGAFDISMAQFFADEGDAVALTPEHREVLILWGALTDAQRQVVKSAMKQFGSENNK